MNQQCKELTETETWKPALLCRSRAFVIKSHDLTKSLCIVIKQASSTCHPYRNPFLNFIFFEPKTFNKAYVEKENKVAYPWLRLPFTLFFQRKLFSNS